MVRSEVGTRFWSHVRKTRGCWYWTGSLDADGYGLFAVDWGRHENGKRWCRTRRAHLVAYEMEIGPIPSGLTVDHLCRRRNCVRPSHLEAVTMRVNALRGEGPTAVNARKTHCKNGHKFTAENTIIRPGRPGRECRKCHREHGRKLRERRRKVVA